MGKFVLIIVLDFIRFNSLFIEWGIRCGVFLNDKGENICGSKYYMVDMLW